MEWNEIAGKVETINRWLRPLKHLEEMPKTIRAAIDEFQAINENIEGAKKELSDIKLEIDKVNKELATVNNKYEKAWNAKLTEINDSANAIQVGYESKFADIEQKRQEAVISYEAMLKDHAAFKDKMAKEKARILADIASAEAKLKDYQETIRKVLGG